jgi:hypothetical protein
MSKFLLSVVATVFSTTLMAQEAGFHPGAIITLDNKRIEGYVKNVASQHGPIENVKFKTAEAEKVTTYSPAELAAYEVEGELFVSKNTEKDYRLFVKKFNSGKLQLYGRLVPVGYVNGNGYVRTSGITYSLFIQLKGDPVIHELEELTFRKQMLSYLSDAPDVCRLIQQRRLLRKDIDKIIELYNKEVAEE